MAIATVGQSRTTAEPIRPPLTANTLSIRPVRSDVPPDIMGIWAGMLIAELIRLGFDPREVVPPQSPLSRLQRGSHVEIDVPVIVPPATLAMIQRAATQATLAAQGAARDFARSATTVDAQANLTTAADGASGAVGGTQDGNTSDPDKKSPAEIGDLMIEDSVRAIKTFVRIGQAFTGLSRGFGLGPKGP